jgi:hypothetical protein
VGCGIGCDRYLASCGEETRYRGGWANGTYRSALRVIQPTRLNRYVKQQAVQQFDAPPTDPATTPPPGQGVAGDPPIPRTGDSSDPPGNPPPSNPPPSNPPPSNPPPVDCPPRLPGHVQVESRLSKWLRDNGAAAESGNLGAVTAGPPMGSN